MAAMEDAFVHPWDGFEGPEPSDEHGLLQDDSRSSPLVSGSSLAPGVAASWFASAALAIEEALFLVFHTSLHVLNLHTWQL